MTVEMTVKMFLGCRCALFVALICAVSGVGPQYVKVGSEVSFKPNPTLSSSNTITWKFSDGGGVIRVIELDHGQSGSAQNPLFKDNAAADKITGELTLTNVRKEHSGLYYFEINGKEQEQKFTLNVMDEVPQPELKRVVTGNPDNAIYLECQYDAIIIWNCTYNDTQKPKLVNGKTILFERTKNLDVCCTCTLKNDVSKKTSKPICESEIFSGSNVGLVIAAVVVATAAAVILFLSCFFIALFMCSDFCHDGVRKKFGKTPCLGAILNGLDSCRNKIKPKGEYKLDNPTTDAPRNGPQQNSEEVKPLNDKESQP